MRDTFGGFAAIQRCQAAQGTQIIERLDPSLHAGVKKVLRQGRDSPTAEQAERVLKNLARRLMTTMPLALSNSILKAWKRNAHRDPAGPARRAAALARLHQRDRELDGRAAARFADNVKRWRDVRRAWTPWILQPERWQAERASSAQRLTSSFRFSRAALLRHQQAIRPATSSSPARNPASIRHSTTGARLTNFNRHRDYSKFAGRTMLMIQVY